jgi:hypothetical protein
MKRKNGQLFSRREFAQRAALLGATASLVNAEVILPKVAAGQSAPPAPDLTPAGQAEAESRYQQIVSLYGEHLDEAQKTNIKRMCVELQPSLERIRAFKLENGDAPALYLKPLVEREKRPQAAPKSASTGSSKKP